MNNQKKPVIVGEFLKYEFTEEEVRQKSKDLALAVQEQTTAQEEQKAAQAQFKERIEGCQSRIGRLSRQINMGWEMRTIDCRVLFHTPTQATKRIVRTDTGDIVREEPMLAKELQENLFNDPEPLDAEDKQPEELLTVAADTPEAEQEEADEVVAD